jgi:hypothetical protein
MDQTLIHRHHLNTFHPSGILALDSNIHCLHRFEQPLRRRINADPPYNCSDIRSVRSGNLSQRRILQVAARIRIHPQHLHNAEPHYRSTRPHRECIHPRRASGNCREHSCLLCRVAEDPKCHRQCTFAQFVVTHIGVLHPNTPLKKDQYQDAVDRSSQGLQIVQHYIPTQASSQKLKELKSHGAEFGQVLFHFSWA